MTRYDRAGDFRERSLGYTVNLAARLYGAALQRRIEPLGVVPGQFAQLLALYEQDGLTASQLAAAVGIEPGTLTKTIQRMVRDGLVERRADPEDRRAVRIHLTDRARDLEAQLKQAAEEVNAIATRQLADGDAERLMGSLRTVIHELQAHLDNDVSQ